jgi:hypothetical protein
MTHIRSGTRRDITYVGANMRPDDIAEIMCQLPYGMSTSDAAAFCHEVSPPDLSFVALDEDGVPCFAFGVAACMTPGLFSAWGFGNKYTTPWCVGLVGSFIREHVIPLCKTKYRARRVEIRSLASRKSTHRWIKSLGARYEANIPYMGVNGEEFILWSFTAPENCGQLTGHAEMRIEQVHPEHEGLQ